MKGDVIYVVRLLTNKKREFIRLYIKDAQKGYFGNNLKTVFPVIDIMESMSAMVQLFIFAEINLSSNPHLDSKDLFS